jgi:hypothetical protein
MSTQIRSFGQPSNVTVSAFENGGATVTSGFGPKNCLRLRSDASMWSKSGAQLSIRGIGPKTFLHARELRLHQPIEVRFSCVNQGAQLRVIPNTYRDEFGSGAKNINTETNCDFATANPQLQTLDSLFMPQNGLFKSMNNLVCSINGTSFQIRPDSFIDSFEKIFGECRFDEYGATQCPPYNNAGGGKGIDQPGLQQRCLNFMQNAKVKHVTYAPGSGQPRIQDIVFEIDMTCKLPIGPFMYTAYPALENLTDCDCHSLPHIHDLSVEFSYKNACPLMYWFKHANNEVRNSMAVDCGSLVHDDAATSANTINSIGQGGIDCFHMWANSVSQEASIAGGTALVNLKRPYLTYVITEAPQNRVSYKDLYTVPSIRFTSYQTEVAIPALEKYGTVHYDYINVDSLSSLVCISAFESQKNGTGGTVGPRQTRWMGTQSAQANYDSRRRGASFANISCKIAWDSLKINLTVRNQVLGSMTAGPETKFDMYRCFLKYSKTKVSFEDWERYSQMILFSPMELCGSALALVEQPVTLSISFDIERCACDTMYCPRDYCTASEFDQGNPGNYLAHTRATGKDDKYLGRAINYTSTLWFLNQEAVKLSPGQCGIEMITFGAQEAESAWSGARKTLEEPVLEQFVS